jgi:diguanylate cyclase (GGDEF)-like protein
MSDIDTKLQDENGRLAALRRYELLDTAPEAPFEKITSLVKTILDTPIVFITLIDANRLWVKSCAGLDVRETPRDIAFCSHTIQSRAPLIIPNTSADPRFADNPLVTGPPFIASYAGIPLETPDGYNIGSLCAMDLVPRAFDAKQIAVLESFAGIVVNEFELRRIAQIDPLTGAISRKAFLAEAEKAISRFTRHARPCSLVMFDLDHFKTVNDTHGHLAGDAVLRAVGAEMHRIMRPSDSFGRLGGEEFAVLLPETETPEALHAANRFRAALEALVIPLEPPLRITASFGAAQLVEGLSLDRWVEKTDLLLYKAKHEGRNRVGF